jgi:hypothetical protein
MSLKQKDNYTAKKLLEEAYQIRFKAKGPTHLFTLQTSELLKQIVI